MMRIRPFNFSNEARRLKLFSQDATPASPPPKNWSLTMMSLIYLASALAVSAPKIEVFTAGAAGFHATSTLIEGEKDAVLVDAQFTRSEAHRLAAQILESGKRLKTVFITHA